MIGRLALLTGLAVCFGGTWFPAGAEEETTPSTPAIIDGLRKEAARNRNLAEQQLEVAQRRRDLETVARTNAMRTSDPMEKRWWLEDLAGYVAKAEELEEYAFFLNQQASNDDSRADRLQTALNAKN